ncbi:MAG: prepilin peptidase [Candidatus Bruticola sp.]
MLEELCSANFVGAVIVFIYGSLIGSFLNVVIYRLPLERSIVYPGSACGTCGTPLIWWENLPIIAYFYLGGRCRVCGSSYSWRYAAVEAFTAAASVFLFYFYNGVNAQFLYSFLFLCLLLVVFFTDFDHWIILDSISYGGIAAGVIGAYFVPLRADFTFFDFSLLPESWRVYEAMQCPWLNVLSSVYGIAIGTAFYWSIQYVGKIISRQEAMGSGDIKLAAMIGAFLGWSLGIVSFFISFVLGAVFAIFMMIFSKKRSKDPLPLGTFMAIGGFLCMLFNNTITDFIYHWPFYIGLWD